MLGSFEKVWRQPDPRGVEVVVDLAAVCRDTSLDGSSDAARWSRLDVVADAWAAAPLRRFRQRFGLHEAPSTPDAAPRLVLTEPAQDVEPDVEAEPVGAGVGVGAGTMSR
jgi:hypothetical protein